MNRRGFFQFAAALVGAVVLPQTVNASDTILTPINATHVHGKQRNIAWPRRHNRRMKRASRHGQMNRFYKLELDQSLRYQDYIEIFPL